MLTACFLALSCTKWTARSAQQVLTDCWYSVVFTSKCVFCNHQCEPKQCNCLEDNDKLFENNILTKWIWNSGYFISGGTIFYFSAKRIPWLMPPSHRHCTVHDRGVQKGKKNWKICVFLYSWLEGQPGRKISCTKPKHCLTCSFLHPLFMMERRPSPNSKFIARYHRLRCCGCAAAGAE